MAKIILGFGLLLILLGLVGYFGSGMASMTALIPAFFGIAVTLCGIIAMKSSRAVVGATIAAAVLALAGMGGTLSRLVPMATSDEGITLSMAVGAQIVMAILSLLLLIACGWYLAVGRNAAAPSASS